MTCDLPPAAVLLAALSGLLLGGCGDTPQTLTPPTLVEVEVFTLDPAREDGGFAAQVTARSGAPVAFQVSGRVDEWLVDTGDQVAAGEVLARIDPRDLQQERDAVSQRLVAARSAQERSERELRRLEDLGVDRFASATELDNARNAATAAGASVRELTAQLALADNRLAYATLRATTAGVITERFVDVDHVVTAGTPAFDLARLDALEVTAWIPETRIGEFQIGQMVNVALWAMPEASFSATVREVAPRADSASRAFRIRATLPPDPRLRLGLSGRLSRTGSAPPTGSVPAGSVRFDAAEQPHVLIVADGRIDRRRITLGQLRDNRLTVVSGLEPGDQVVVLGARELDPGQEVHVQRAP